MNNETLRMFKTLTELPGAPGNEHAVRTIYAASLKSIQMN